MRSATPFGERMARGGEVMQQRPRVLRPNRAQIELRAPDLEGLLPEDHRARAVWEFVEGLDLSVLYERIESVEGHAGRPAIDPGILLALWIYATAEGVGSARALERLCGQHDAYRWICGGVAVSAHTLSDFRVAHGSVLDALLTQSVAQLMAEGLVDLRRVAQDGLRVRASAGAASFRRRRRLREFLREAGEQVGAAAARARRGSCRDVEARGGGAGASGPGAQAPRDAGVGGDGAGGGASHPAGSESTARTEEGIAGLDDGSRGPGDADGRWGLSPCLQCPARDRCRQPDHRGRGRDGTGKRQRSRGTDARADRAALWRVARVDARRRWLPVARGHRRRGARWLPGVRATDAATPRPTVSGSTARTLRHAGDRAVAAAHGDTRRKAGLPTACGYCRMCERDCTQSRAAAIPGARTEEGAGRSALVRARAQCSAWCRPTHRCSRGSVGAGHRSPRSAGEVNSQRVGARR